jgi:fibro-slime domain-containing protein
MFRKTPYIGGLFFLIVCSLLKETPAQTIYSDTLWAPVIFYDYWIDNNGANPDFEITPAQLVTGMVYDTLDKQRKPVPTPIACPTPSTNAPAACHLSQWFRVSGVGGSDNACIFVCDSLTNPSMQRWKWTTATGGPLTPYGTIKRDFVGPNFDSTNTMRNVIIYDSLPFIHLGKTNPAQLGVYQYSNSGFFPIDNRGFGIQPTGSLHNFGFTMEMHAAFTFQRGLNLTFAGDDDCWIFINGKKVVDLGGRHATLTSSINLDTMSGLIIGKKYNIDFYQAERHTTGSDIRLTTNFIAPPQTSVLSDKLPQQDKMLSNGSSRTLHYSLPSRSYVSLKYFDISGRMVASFFNQFQNPGAYSLSIPDATLKPGAYIQMFSAGNFARKTLFVVGR